MEGLCCGEVLPGASRQAHVIQWWGSQVAATWTLLINLTQLPPLTLKCPANPAFSGDRGKNPTGGKPKLLGTLLVFSLGS